MDRPWRDLEYVVIDVETTGLDLKRDSIASYGAVVIRAGRIITCEDTYGLVQPSCALTPASVTVHALRPADVADAPPLSDAVAVLAPLLTDRILIAHAAWIEKAFLGRAFNEHGKSLCCPVIDTAALAREADIAPRRPVGCEPALESLAGNLGVPVVQPHHALGDAMTTAHVFFALVARLHHRGHRTARDFVDLTAADQSSRVQRKLRV